MKIIELPNFTLVHDYDASMIIGDSLSLLQNSWKGGQTDRKASGGDFLPPQLTTKHLVSFIRFCGCNNRRGITGMPTIIVSVWGGETVISIEFRNPDR